MTTSTTKYAVTLNQEEMEWLLKKPAKCSKCGETKPGDQLTGGVCDGCIITKPRTK
jgi:predicted Zn-ribbon and HTH transcriptional regulator